MPNRISRSLILIGTILLATQGLMSQTTAVLKEITLQKEGDRLNILLKVEGTYTIEASFMPAPPRLVMDLTPMSQIQVLPYTQIDDIGVLDIRTGQYKPETARIVFDLSQNVPAYTVSQSADGVKITFFYEGVVLPIQAPAQEQPVAPTEKITPAAAVAEEPPLPKHTNFFASVRGGVSLFLSSDLTGEKNFTLYGETGGLNSSYGFATSPSYEIQFGKYLGRTKIGLNIAYSSIAQSATFVASLPHPFTMNAFREVNFEAVDLKNETWSISAFALFTLLETKKFNLSAGPIVGLAKGRLQSLEDFSFSERSPYSSGDVTITDLVYAKDPYTSLLFGAQLGFDYGLNERLSLVFDLRIIYLNPMNATMNVRFNQLRFQPVVGIQYNF